MTVGRFQASRIDTKPHGEWRAARRSSQEWSNVSYLSLSRAGEWRYRSGRPERNVACPRTHVCVFFSRSSQTSLGRVAVNAHAPWPLTVVNTDSTCPTPTSLRPHHEAVVAISHLTSPPLITKPRTEINLGPLSTPHRAPPRTEYIQYGPCLTRRRRSSAPYANFFFAVKKVSHPLFSVFCLRAIKMWGLRGCRGHTPYRAMRRSFGRIRRRKEDRQIARSSLIRFDPTIYCTSNWCVLRSFFLMLRRAQCTHPTNSTRHITR